MALLLDSNKIYLHYWYDDYKGKSLQLAGDTTQRFTSEKNRIKEEQLKSFRDLKMSALSYTGDKSKIDFEEMAEIFFGKEAMNKRYQIFNARLEGISVANFLKSIKSSGFNEVGNGSMQSFITNVKKGNVDLSDITNTTQRFLDALNNNLSETFNKLFKGDTWEEYKKDVVKEYIATKGLSNASSGSIGMQILEDFKQDNRDVFVELPDIHTKMNYDKVIQSSLKQLAMIETGLSLGSTTGQYKGDSSYFREVSRLVSGLLTNVAGSGFEYMQSQIETEALLDGVVLKQLKIKGFDATTAKANSVACGTATIPDPKVDKAIANGKRTEHRSTADTQATFSISDGDGILTVTYGGNIKNYQGVNTKTKGRHLNLKIKDRIPFLDALEYGTLGFAGSGFYTYLLNVAGGHPENRKSKSGTSGPELTQAWKEIVDLATINGMFHALAGTGSKGDSCVIVIINGIPYTVGEVIEKMFNEKDPTSANFSSKVRYRNNFMALNYWRTEENHEKKGRAKHMNKNSENDRRSTEAAKARSLAATRDIYQALAESKITIYLNFFSAKM